MRTKVRRTESSYWSRRVKTETVASFAEEGYTIEESVYRDGYTLYRIRDTRRGGDLVASVPSYIEALEYARDFLRVNITNSSR